MTWREQGCDTAVTKLEPQIATEKDDDEEEEKEKEDQEKDKEDKDEDGQIHNIFASHKHLCEQTAVLLL